MLLARSVGPIVEITASTPSMARAMLGDIVDVLLNDLDRVSHGPGRGVAHDGDRLKSLLGAHPSNEGSSASARSKDANRSCFLLHGRQAVDRRPTRIAGEDCVPPEERRGERPGPATTLVTGAG